MSGRGRLIAFVGVMFLIAFLLNWLWEILQISAYADLDGRALSAIMLHCGRAALGDAAITVGVYGIGALAAGTLAWGLRPGWNVYATGALLGFIQAALIERAATLSGRWSYSDRMPIVPGLDVGLWPLLQLTVLVPISWLVAQAVVVRQPKS